MDLALVGLVLPHVENHSLDALRRAAGDAGYASRVVPFSGWADLDSAVRTITRERPRVCGVSIQTTEVALAALSFVRMLRMRGYDGKVVCGGHFSTLNAESILDSRAGVDAVVRFAGEEALVGLLGDPSEAELRTLPGLVFRDSKGALREGAPPRASLATRLDGPLPVHLGFGAADLVVSRGCEHKCAYCCVAGASSLLARAGGERYERRGIAAIADEIAQLFHDRDARVFNFMDDNVLPTAPAEAAAFARELRLALDSRGVGRLAFSMQLRGDAVDEESALALAELGLVRAYVGVDGYSAEQLRRLGRRSEPEAGARAMRLLSERGVLAICNALLIGPTVRFEDLRAELVGLARIEHGPVHLLPIDVRAGSRYFELASRRGLVEGSFVYRHYRFEDPRTARVARAMSAMPTRLEERSVPIGLYDLAYNLGIARRLADGAELEPIARAWHRVATQWNADQLRFLGLAIDASDDDAAIDRLIAKERGPVRAHDEALLMECDRALAEVERAVSRARRTPVRMHPRGMMLSAVAASMSLVGCYRSHTIPGAPSDAGVDARVSLDAGFDAGRDAGIDAPPFCPDGREVAYDPNDNPCIPFCAEPRLQLTFDEDGIVVDMALIEGDLPDELRMCLDDFFRGVCYPSLAGGTSEVGGHCWVA